MPLDLTKLREQINRIPDIEQSVKTLLERLFAEFLSHAGDQAAVEALATEGQANLDAIVADVMANTPPSTPSARTR